MLGTLLPIDVCVWCGVRMFLGEGGRCAVILFFIKVGVSCHMTTDSSSCSGATAELDVHPAVACVERTTEQRTRYHSSARSVRDGRSHDKRTNELYSSTEGESRMPNDDREKSHHSVRCAAQQTPVSPPPSPLVPEFYECFSSLSSTFSTSSTSSVAGGDEKSTPIEGGRERPKIRWGLWSSQDDAWMRLVQQNYEKNHRAPRRPPPDPEGLKGQL